MEKKSFFKGVQAEFKKIVWPDKNTMLKQSFVVVVISVVLGLLITVLDLVMEIGVNFLTTM